jgi:hypothetical protein
MTDESDPFNGLDLQEAIDLRWTLRDIRAKRWKLSPLNPSHLEKLKSMNLIEMHDDEPALTKAGSDAMMNPLGGQATVQPDPNSSPSK